MRIATHESEALFPSLWKDLLGAFCPSKQPNGGALINLAENSSQGPASSQPLSFNGEAHLRQFGGFRALALDGATDSVDVYPMQYAHNAAKGWSVSFWIYEITKSTYAVPVCLSFTSGGEINGLASAGALLFSVIADNALIPNTGAPRVTGSWNHYAATYDGTTHTSYFNGIAGTGAQNDAGYGFGRNRLGYGFAAQSVNGYLNDMLTYKRALTLREIMILKSRQGAIFERRARKRYIQIPALSAGASGFNVLNGETAGAYFKVIGAG